MSHKILKNFTYRTPEVLVPLFKSLVRSILEYANPVWNTSFKKYITLIEQVQRKYTKHVTGLKDLTYEDRLAKLNLPSLEYRRFRGDHIQVFKISRRVYNNDTNNLIQFTDDTRLRGNDFKITKTRTDKKQLSEFFSFRIVNSWNNLPNNIVNADSLNAFKNLFDEYHCNMMFRTNIFY